MTNDEKNRIALSRYSVILGLVTELDESKSNHVFFRSIVEKQWINENNEKVK